MAAVVATITRLQAGRPSSRGSIHYRKKEALVFSTALRSALGPTVPHSLLFSGCQGFFTQGIKRPGKEAGHTPPTSAQVKNERS